MIRLVLTDLDGTVLRTTNVLGQLSAHIYADVPAVLKAWHQAGIDIYSFSSGAVPVQQQMLAQNNVGDLLWLFTGYFDTSVGSKREVASYTHIQNSLGIGAGEILFLSDNVYELNAAHECGMHTVGLDRECICDGFHAHPYVHDFSQIRVEFALNLR